MLQKFTFSLIVSVFTFFSLAQTDFDNYKTLMSFGQIPQDFTRSTKSKMEDDLAKSESEMSKKNKEAFYEGVNYSIDEMLHSGDVIYGDPISNYASEIVDRLLKDDPNLRAKLRIYTIKSNATNAFSTDQGILFVTTGLMAQITSEAQLAFILAHEISHFTHKHVIETFDWKSRVKNHNFQISKLSSYSKEKEFDADKTGLQLYHKAGYPLDAIFETFDVLMYSYLPFEEIEFPKSYFNTSQTYLPDYLFPTEKYPIKAEEDYDDSESTHPNIKKRKEAVEATVGEFSGWGESNFYLGETRFAELRNIARFENVRSDVVDANLGDALYSIFILERNFPNSAYLKRMKAQVWLGLLSYKAENKVNSVVDKNRELEGESAAIHFFLKKVSKEGMFTLALRQIYDLYKANPQLSEIAAIYDRCVKIVAGIEKFKIESYSTKTFDQAAKEFELHKKDSVTPQQDTTTKKSDSKYSKIKNKKNASNPENFDSTKFYLYAIGDIIKDSSFLQLYSLKHKEYKEQEAKEDAFNELSRKERDKLKKKNASDALKLGLNEIIVVEPKVFSSRGQKGFDPMKSEQIETNYSEIIETVGEDIGVAVHPIDRRNMEKGGTASFNERAILISFLSQLVNDDDVDVFPVDFEMLREIQNNYGTSKVMFTIVEHRHEVDIKWGWLGASLIMFPVTPIFASIHIPMAIFKANNTEMTVLVLDLEKGVVSTGANFYFNEPVRKLNLGAHVYDIFSTMKKTKN